MDIGILKKRLLSTKIKVISAGQRTRSSKMSYNCRTHNQEATAYCQAHKTTLCTRCFIENAHKERVCSICEIKDLTDKDRAFLTAQNLHVVIEEKREDIRKGTESLEDLKRSLEAKVQDHFSEIVEKLDEKKRKSYVLLRKQFDRMNLKMNDQSKKLELCSSELNKYSQECESKDSSTIGINIVELTNKIEDINVEILGENDGKYLRFDDKSIFEGKVESLGAFDFKEDIYDVPYSEPVVNVEAEKVKVKDHPDSYSSDIYESIPSDRIGIEDIDTCKFDKIHVLKDDRFLLLDSKSGKLLIVDGKGTVINTFPEKDKPKTNLSNWCLIKKDKVAVLGFEETDPYIEQVKILPKDTFQTKKKTWLKGKLKRDECIMSLSFDVKSSTYAVVLKDQVVHIDVLKDKTVGSHCLETQLIGETSELDMIYDFQGDVVYTLDKKENLIRCYACKTSKILWSVKSSVADAGKFQPLAISLDKTDKSVVVICTEKILWLNLSNGEKSKEKECKFYPDLNAFCFWKNDVLTSRDPMAGGGQSVAKSLYRHLGILSPDKPKEVYKSPSSAP